MHLLFVAVVVRLLIVAVFVCGVDLSIAVGVLFVFSTLRGRCVLLSRTPLPLCKGSSRFLL